VVYVVNSSECTGGGAVLASHVRMDRRPLAAALLLVAIAFAVLATARCGNGAGPPFPDPAPSGADGGPDGGPADDDGGPGTGGGADAGPALAPIRADCDGFHGIAEDCWGEWLKIVHPVDFSPVERGALGAGPWPATTLVHLGASEGLTEWLLGVGADTGQNQYAVSSSALYVRRVGDTTFTRYARGTSGLRDYAFLSVAGAGPGIAWVGHEGLFGVDPENDPPDVRKSGDVDVVTLGAGGISVRSLDTHNSNTPFSGRFDHSRSIFEIVVPRRGAAAGEVFLGTEHGMVRYQGDLYVDHVHIATEVNGSQRFGQTGGIAVADDGTAWYGSAWAFGGRTWAPRRFEWYSQSRWLFPSRAFGSDGTENDYQGVALDPAGAVWLGARNWGLARLAMSPDRRRATIDTFAAPDADIRDIAADPDGTIWVGAGSGLYRFTPSSGVWNRSPDVPGDVTDLFLDDTVAPRALYAASGSGMWIWRGP